MIWTPDTPDPYCLPEGETTYADESLGEGRLFHGGQAYPPEFIAQVDHNVDLRWVREVRRRTGLPELKFRDAHVWLLKIDSRLHGTMEETWKRTNIVITDPGPSVRKASDRLLELVPPGYLEHPDLPKILRGIAARDLLGNTPLHRLSFLVEMIQPGLWLPGKTHKLPDWADPSKWYRRFKGSLRRAREFVGRLNAAYWVLCDDATLEQEIERSMQDAGVFGVHPNFARVLILASLPCRFFDSGHDKAVADIRKVRSESLNDVPEHYRIAFREGRGRIDSLVSTTCDHLQAADIAAGLAKTDYERDGISAVLRRFRAVLYNGKVIR